MLKDLLKLTPSNHPSYTPLFNAKLKIDAVVTSINESKKTAENNLRVAEIATKIVKLVCILINISKTLY